MEDKLTPEQAIKILRDDRINYSPRIPGVKPISIHRANEISALIESLAADAALGRAAVEVLDNLPHCQGEFDSAPCLYVREISSNKGCHLEGVCRLRAGKGGEKLEHCINS